MSQILIVLSALAEARRLPSGLKETLLTAHECPLRVLTSWPVSASQTFTVLSALAEARRLPSGLKQTTEAACPSLVRTPFSKSPVFTHKIPPVTWYFPQISRPFSTSQVFTF